MKKNIAVILAGGSGSRFGANMPKQFLEVGGKMIIEHTIDAFERHPMIDAIAIVSRKDFIEEMNTLASRYNKVTAVLEGGKERYHSSLAAINRFKEPDDRLLIHDAVRPLVSERIITDCIEALNQYDAVEVAVPTTDTIIELDAEGNIARIPPRALLRNVQTPQCFRRQTIALAFERALAAPDFFPTDDCSLVHRYLPDTPIKVVEGESINIKITYKEDLNLVKKTLSL